MIFEFVRREGEGEGTLSSLSIREFYYTISIDIFGGKAMVLSLNQFYFLAKR